MQTRCQCDAPIDGDEISWLGKDGNDICQNCWEAESDAEWWKMVQRVQGVVLEPEVAPEGHLEGSDG